MMRKYDDEFKQQSVRKIIDGQSVASFAKGIRQDLAAIKAAIETPWSNGQVKGQVNRLKTIKRTMYGRANFDLLQAKVLYAI